MARITSAVIGLGKIGLPLAAQFIDAGHKVIGVDNSTDVVDALTIGSVHVSEPGVAALLEPALRDQRFEVTGDLASVKDANTVVVVVPVTLDSAATPALGGLEQLVEELGQVIRAGVLVTFETTLPVGTTRRRLAPSLAESSGLELGIDLFVGYSPERVYSGRVLSDLRRYPKLVGGVDAPSTRRAVEFYSSVLNFDRRDDLQRPNGVWSLGTSDAAELAKLAETTYRDVNIALANEFARFADRAGLDIEEIIDACNSQPFSRIHRPGISVGGHCIPVYPHMYLAGDPLARLPRESRKINNSMPTYCANLLAESSGPLRDRAVVILGVTYRGGVKETAYSGAFQLRDALTTVGARVSAHDPLLSPAELREIGFESYDMGQFADAAIVHTDHAEYRHLRPNDLPGVRTILDGRGVLEREKWPGVVVKTLGRSFRDQ